jgi:anti-sigma factor RsiW
MTDRLVAGLRCSEVADLVPAFVLGALEDAEMATVRAHLAACPEPHPELAELGAGASALLLAVPQVEPPAALGSRILEAARRDTVRPPAPEVRRPVAPVAPVPAPARERGGFLGLGRPVWATAGLAAVLAIAILGVQAFNLQRERDDLAAYQSGVAAVLDTAAGPGAQLAVLSGGSASAGPAGIAAVGSDGTVKIAMRGLGATQGTQVYEAWLIVGKNAPEPIGGFAVGSTGSATLQTRGTTAAGVVIALTLEPGPGATTPTLPIVASGAAQSKPG